MNLKNEVSQHLCIVQEKILALKDFLFAWLIILWGYYLILNSRILLVAASHEDTAEGRGATNTQQATSKAIGTFISICRTWINRIGGVVAFVGAIEFALGWQREDAEAKTKGLRIFMAGIMVIAMVDLALAVAGY